MSRDKKRFFKRVLSECGVDVFQKDMKTLKLKERVNIGHKCGWTKDIYNLTMKDGTVYECIIEPTSIYSGAMKYSAREVR